MLKKLTVATFSGAALLLSAQANADVMGVLAGTTGAGGNTWTNVHASVSGGSGFTNGAGVGFAGSTPYTVTGFGLAGTTQATALAANDFVTWGLSFNQAWNLDSFDIAYLRGSQGPDDMAIQISINGGPFTNVHTDTAVATTTELHQNINLQAFDNVTSVSFRMLGWLAGNTTTTNGWFQFQNNANIQSGSFRLNATAVPEPAAAGLLGLLALGLLRRRYS